MEVNWAGMSGQNISYSDYDAAVEVVDNLIEIISSKLSTSDFLNKNDVSLTANIVYSTAEASEENGETTNNDDNCHKNAVIDLEKDNVDSDDCIIIPESPMITNDENSSDEECEIIGELLYTPINSVSTSHTFQNKNNASHCSTPSTSREVMPLVKATPKMCHGKSTSRRKTQNSSNNLDNKIAEVEKWKFECVKQIKKLEEQELPDGIEGELILEKIDKLRRKAIQFEESLSKFVVYEDAEYNEFMSDENRICVDYKIVITDTDLEPLNTLLTKHVNRLMSSEDIRSGYRCVTVDHVEEMLKIIHERGDCSVYDIIVPKDKEQLENFLLKIVEMANRCCRQTLFKQLIDEDYISSDSRTLPVDNGMMGNETAEKIVDADVDCKPTLSERLLIMKSEGLLNATDENDPGEEIDLCNSDEEEYDIEMIPNISPEKTTKRAASDSSKNMREAPSDKKLRLLANAESISLDKYECVEANSICVRE